jgi:DNA polymerase-3 subunit gamma/tau
MDFVVTARKWRPQIFEEVVGQAHISKTIKNAIVNNRVAHAYLFAGPRGVGKTTTARILAKALNCKNNVDGEPCNNCDNCNAFNSNQSLDIIEIDGASNRRIEEIRALREAVKYAPTTGSYKIFIIDEVHMLTTESFNALLKTLEEPPEHAIFIFATTDVHKVPLTIISRCQRFDFRRIELNAIKAQLSKIATSDKITIDDQALTFIAKKADGALRDAQSLFDQVISFGGKEIDASIVSSMLNLIDEDIYFNISDAILNKDFLEAFEISKTIYDNGWNYIDFMSGLTEHFRNILTVILKQDSTFVEASENVKKMYLEYIDTFSEPDLLKILTYLNKVESQLRASNNQKLLMEISLSHLIGLESTTTISQLIKNLSEGNFISEDKKKSSPQINRAEVTTPKPQQESLPKAKVEPTQNISATQQIKQSESIANVDTNVSKEESSLINAIISELGGRELK